MKTKTKNFLIKVLIASFLGGCCGFFIIFFISGDWRKTISGGLVSFLLFFGVLVLIKQKKLKFIVEEFVWIIFPIILAGFVGNWIVSIFFLKDGLKGTLDYMFFFLLLTGELFLTKKMEE